MREANYEKESEVIVTDDGLDRAEVSGPDGGREVNSKVIHGSNGNAALPTVNTIAGAPKRPTNTGLEAMQQITLVNALDAQPIRELEYRKDSFEPYKEELEKIAKSIAKSELDKAESSKHANKEVICSMPNNEPTTEFRLKENYNRAMVKLFSGPRQWISPGTVQTVQQNLQVILERKDRAVHIVDQSILGSTDFGVNRQLFVSKHNNSFYLGRYKQKPALVKKIAAKVLARQKIEQAGSEPVWVSIAKRISYSQQIELSKVNKANVRAESESSTLSGLSSDVSTSISMDSTGESSAAWRPFLQIYEIFYLTTERSLLVFVEMASNKTLHHHIKRRTPTHINQARLWCAQVLDGVTFLARHAIAHRSLRLEHLVLDNSTNVRIFGWRRAKAITGVVTGHRQRRLRMNNHFPPEAFLGPYQAGSVDLWSWGVLLCALSTFRYPFNVRQSKLVEDQWASFKTRHNSSCHPQVTAILDGLFLSEPDKRSSVNTIQQSAFFAVCHAQSQANTDTHGQSPLE